MITSEFEDFAMKPITRLAKSIMLIVALGTPVAANAQDKELQKLDGTWLFVEDRTEGRAIDMGGPPMSVRFTLRVENDVVVYPRPRGDERITLDGSVIESKNDNASVTRHSGKWNNNDGWLEYTLETVRLADSESLYVLKRVFRVTDDGLLVYVFSNKTSKQVALYRHPEDIALPTAAKATIADMAWLADAWTGMKRTSSIEERWNHPKGGAMFGVSQTVRDGKMTAFEFLRIVERDGGLVYVAQPGGNAPTEFVLTEINNQRAVFANPRHDYPQRIIYELSDNGTLTASIGFARGRLQSFEFRRESH